MGDVILQRPSECLQLEWPLGKLLHPSVMMYLSVWVQIAAVDSPKGGSTEPALGIHRAIKSTKAPLSAYKASDDVGTYQAEAGPL